MSSLFMPGREAWFSLKRAGFRSDAQIFLVVVLGAGQLKWCG